MTKSPLRLAREERELRQQDVADQAGCAVSLVSMTEAGYRPSKRLQERIAAAVGASSGSFWP